MHHIKILVLDAAGRVVEELPRYDDVAKRRLIAAELVDEPDQGCRTVAARFGVNHRFVARVRERLELAGTIPRLEKAEGRDGIRRPLRQRRRSRDPGSR